MKKSVFLICLILLGCEKEITLNLPQAESKIVVEGSIEPNFPPYVILTKSQGYFEPIDINTYNASVSQVGSGVPNQLIEFLRF